MAEACYVFLICRSGARDERLENAKTSLSLSFLQFHFLIRSSFGNFARNGQHGTTSCSSHFRVCWSSSAWFIFPRLGKFINFGEGPPGRMFDRIKSLLIDERSENETIWTRITGISTYTCTFYVSERIDISTNFGSTSASVSPRNWRGLASCRSLDSIPRGKRRWRGESVD